MDKYAVCKVCEHDNYIDETEIPIDMQSCDECGESLKDVKHVEK